MEIFNEIQDNIGDSIKRQNQEDFLLRVLEWLLATDETVDISLVTDIIKLLIKQLDAFNSEDLQGESIKEELNNLYEALTAKDIELPGFEEEE